MPQNPPIIQPIDPSLPHVTEAAARLNLPEPSPRSRVLTDPDTGEFCGVLYAPKDPFEHRMMHLHFPDGESLAKVTSTSGGLPDWGMTLWVCQRAGIHPSALTDALAELGRMAFYLSRNQAA